MVLNSFWNYDDLLTLDKDFIEAVVVVVIIAVKITNEAGKNAISNQKFVLISKHLLNDNLISHRIAFVLQIQ